MPDQIYAVVGATGQQGGAVARHLLHRGARVRALVRNLDHTDHHLADRGAEVVQADLKDPAGLRRAFDGVDGIFAMATMAQPSGVEGEIADGRAIANAAQAVGGPPMVYSSVGGAERKTGIPHFESKRRIEEYIATLQLPAIILRPVFFMDNFRTSAAPREENGHLVLRLPLPADAALQMIASDDIGGVAASVLLDPSQLPTSAVEIAGDELTGEQIAEAFGADRGLPSRYEPLPLSSIDDKDQRAMFAWFARTPAFHADFALTRRLAPDTRAFPTWLRAPGEPDGRASD